MDIKIGKALTVGGRETEPHRNTVVEAKLLAVREARHRGSKAPVPGGPERRQQHSRDPINGRVLVLMVPDRRVLPPDLDLSKYRVFLRFARS